jgi:outer membrane protein assembly factor BamB
LGLGALLVKVRKLAGDDEFLIQTPNTAAGVRGTEYLIRYGPEKLTDSGKENPGTTIVAVRSGKVAVLPKGPLLTGLLDGRAANPLAGAVVSTAFAFAPVVGSGQELTVGGIQGCASVEEAESRYGALVRAAEDAQAQGTDFEGVQDPPSVLVPADSALRRHLELMGSLVPVTGLSSVSETYLSLLDRLRDPESGTSKLPAAFPQTFFSSPRTRPSALTPEPSYPYLSWQKFVSSVSLSEQIGHVGPSILALDSRGLLHCFDDQGRMLWTKGPEVLSFTSLEQTVALVEKSQLRIVDGHSGAEMSRWTYPGWAALPQYKGVPVPQGLAMATPQGVIILRQENAQIVKEIPLPGGVIAPLVLMDKRLAAYSGSGTLYFIDTATATVVGQLSLNLGTEILTPRYMDGRGYFASRQGRLVAVDTTGDRILWKRSLTVGIKADPELDSQRLYLWTSDNSLRRLSTRDGSDVGTALPSVDSPPLLSLGRLYLGLGKNLIVADAATISIVKTLPLPDVPGGRPLIIDGSLYLGTKDGRLIRLELPK